MKLTHLLLAATALWGLTACSDYDNGYDEKKISFEKEFVNAFDDIDPEQDWNMAERAFVTVTTGSASRVKIYALLGGTYCIVGDYSNVSGTRELGFDMLEGTESIMVSDGRTAVQTTPGGTADLTQGTRTVYGGKGIVGISKITDANGITIGGTNYPMYKEATAQNYEDMKSVIPEIGNRKSYTNLNRVSHDFTYVSTGKFIIYPYYWETSSLNTIGIYYYDESGQRQEVDVYTIREGDELQYHKKVGVYESPYHPEEITTIGNAAWYKDWRAMTWTTQTYNMLGSMGLPNGDLLSRFSELVVDVDMKKYTTGVRVLFYKSDGTNKAYRIPNPSPSASGTQNVKETINLQSLVSQEADWKDYLENCSEVRLAGDNKGNTTFKDNIGNDVIGDVVINDLKFQTSSDGGWQNYGEIFCSEIFTRYESDKMHGQGILIDIPAGTVFGMYLKKADWENGSQVPYTFYSESSLNDPIRCGNGVTDDNQGHVTQVEGMHPCYASTFHVNALGNQMFLGFEDWPNTANASDFDLNDVVFAFSGATPTIINEDTTPAGTWMLACEDLGGSFDLDYNDVVLKINHISGQNYATVTPLAAGGTLASYIFFIDPTSTNGQLDQCFGEIHQLFGAGAISSGEYEPINVKSGSRGAQGREVRFNVPEDWTMAYYSSDTWNQSSQYAPNMGGFEIRTLPIGAPPIDNANLDLSRVTSLSQGASRIPAPDKGKAPFIICLPYSYFTLNQPSVGKKTEYVWAWPQEYVGITTCYPDFAAWVGNMSENGEWYKNRTPNSLTVDPLEIVTDMTAEEKAATIEGETGGTTVVTNKQNPTFFGTWGSIINLKDSYTTAWNADTESHTASIYTGEKLKATAYLNNYSGGSGTISAQLSAGNTGAYLYNHGEEFYVVGGNNSGQATLTIHFTGDDTYNAKDITIYINVKERKIYQFVAEKNGKQYALTNDNGTLKIAPVDTSNKNQMWAVEREGGNSKYNFIYSVGACKYLVSAGGSGGSPYAPTLQESRPDNNEYGRFKFMKWTNAGKELTYLYLRHYERSYELKRTNYNEPMYMGVDKFNDWEQVWFNKTGSQVFNFTMVDVKP